MTVRTYRSSDASAPVIDGQVGSLVNLLDKVLVAGYGAKTAAGWTKPYTSGSHSAVFTQGGGSGFSLDVNDNGPGAGTYKEARVRGYETMSAVATGTGPFPTVAQQASGLFVRKSTAADATTRTWIMFADDSTFYLFIQTGDAASTYYAFMFGDFYSYVASDPYQCMLVARATENSGTNTVENLDIMGASTGTFSARTGHYVARGYTGLGGAVQVGKYGDVGSTSTTNTSIGTHGTHPFPDPVLEGGLLSKLFVTDPTTTPVNGRRGYMRGLYHFPHPLLNVIDTDQYVGSGDFAGKQFWFVKSTGNTSVYCVETTNWDTS